MGQGYSLRPFARRFDGSASGVDDVSAGGYFALRFVSRLSGLRPDMRTIWTSSVGKAIKSWRRGAVILNIV